MDYSLKYYKSKKRVKVGRINSNSYLDLSKTYPSIEVNPQEPKLGFIQKLRKFLGL